MHLPTKTAQFGPYEVEHEGRRYFGNVTLREHHLFEHDACAYVLDVERLAAQPVPSGLAGAIAGLGVNFGRLVAEPLMEALRGLRLVAGEESAAPPVRREQGPGDIPGPAVFPVTHVGLFLAQECNMRCVYCYGNAGQYGGGGLMDEPTAKRAVDWLFENSGSAPELAISFFGGEPLLNFPLMRTIVPFARRKAAERGKMIAFDMTTNGSLLTDDILAFIRGEDIRLLVSFDGPPEVQNGQRPFKDGSGSYATVAANVRRLLQVLPRVDARATLLGDTDPALVWQGLRKVGFTSCRLAPSSPALLNRPDSEADEDRAGERATARLRAVHRMEIEDLLLAVQERRLESAPSPALGVLHGLATRQKQHYGCGVGKTLAAIAVNGDVYPCHRFVGLAKMRQGNIASYRATTLNSYHRAVVDNLPECRACWARYLCGGGCFHQNKAATGDVRRPGRSECRAKQSLIEQLVHIHCQWSQADRNYVRDMLKSVDPQQRHPGSLQGGTLERTLTTSTNTEGDVP